MKQPTASLTDVSTYLPGEPIGASYYAQFAGSDELADNLMFRAPKFRHHVAADETAVDMVERAAAGVIERNGRDVIANVDVLITHTQMPDMPFYGGGGSIAHRLGMRPNWVLDLHNGGCAAFVLGLKVARRLLTSGEGRTALVEGVAVTFGRHLERLAPVTQEHPIGLIGHQQIDLFGRQPDTVADRERDLGNLPVAARQHLGDLAFGETDAAFTRSGLPPFPGRVDGNRHVAGVFAVGAALDIENR